MSIACVVPTNRPDKFADFFEKWKPYFKKHEVTLYIIEDNPTAQIEVTGQFTIKHFTQADAEGLSAIPIRTGSIRSLGLLKAYQDGHDYIVTLDDDCHPSEMDTIQEFMDGFKKKWSVCEYFDVGNTFGLNEFMRGYPMWEREVAEPMIQYGGWDNVPDMDALTQMRHEDNGDVDGKKFDRTALSIPKGIAFTGCIMNTALKREAVPMLYQHMMGIERVGYDRADDIWSGYFSKKICDHLNQPIIINGKASIVHTRASNTRNNLEKELLAYGYNDVLWKNLKGIEFTSNTVIGCYEELTNQVQPEWFGPRGDVIIKGMREWLKLIKS